MGTIPVDFEVAIPAATVIIARNGSAGLEILVIERAVGMGFAGGAVAFPGGKVDPGDLPDGAAIDGFGSLPPEDAAARVAGAREAFEESGVLLSTGPAARPELRNRLRLASDRHETGFSDILNLIGHRLDAAALIPFARWLPPSGLHKRFDTRFYLASLPKGEVMRADGYEAVSARWQRPSDILAEADAGRISLLFPTRCNVARLAAFASVETLLADPTPPPFVQPVIDADWLHIPDNIGYPWTREQLNRARRS